MSIADGGDEDLMGIENSQLEQATFSPSPEEHFLQTARRDRGAVHRAVQRQAVHGEVRVLPQGILAIRNT